MSRLTLGVFFVSSSLLLNNLWGAEKRIECNVAEFSTDQQRIKRVMDKVIEASEGKIPNGQHGLTTVQHIDGKKYLIRRGQMPVEAAIIHESSSVLADGTHLNGYFFPTGETFTYTTIIGAKATVKLSDFHNSKYPFESVANFIEVLKNEAKFYCFGSSADCEECTGWGKIKAMTQTGWKECANCKGKGKVPVQYEVVWKKTVD